MKRQNQVLFSWVWLATHQVLWTVKFDATKQHDAVTMGVIWRTDPSRLRHYIIAGAIVCRGRLWETSHTRAKDRALLGPRG